MFLSSWSLLFAGVNYCKDFGNFCYCITSSTQLNYKKLTSHSKLVGLTHISYINRILLHSSVRRTASWTSKRIVVLTLKFFLQLLFWVDIRLRICVFFLVDLRGVIHRLLSYWKHLSCVTSFFHLLISFLLFSFFHLHRC